MNSFMGIEIGKRSIATHQSALSVTGHNIANASTEGYTRQIAEIVTTQPWYTPSLNGDNSVGQLGTGVTIDEIARIRDEFVDAQIRNENKTSGYWTQIQECLTKMEVIVNEPSEDGLRTVMDEFWSSWEDLAANPESDAVRAVVAERGTALADTFIHTYNQLIDLKEDLNASVKVEVDEINSIAQQLKNLNQQILSITVAGKEPNDLLDKRDLLLDQLSGIVDINIHEEATGMVAVQIGGRTLVQGIEMNKLSTVADTDGMYMVVWDDTKTKANITANGGQLAGLLDARGETNLSADEDSDYKEIISQLLDELNSMAKTIIVKTNELHRSGYSLNNKSGYPDGQNFFTMPADPDSFEDWAASMQVSQSIRDNPQNIASASNRTWNANGNKSNFGDGSNALAIARLKQSLNQAQYNLKTEDLTIDLNSDTPLEYLIDTGSGIQSIQIAAPSSYQDLESLAAALQEKLDELELPVQVRGDGEQLCFYSTSAVKLEVIIPDSGLSDLSTSGLQDGQYRLDSSVVTSTTAAANLEELQHYNQSTAISIFGSGQMDIASIIPQNINASIELTVTDANTGTGEVIYNYKSHEYDLDGNYTSQTGTFTLTYGGTNPQMINIGSLQINITGLDAKSNIDVTELQAGDKGVLNLTAATDGAAAYQKLDLSLDYGEPDAVSQSFIFNDGALNGLTNKELHFFTLNDNSTSEDTSGNSLYGNCYDGYISLTTGTLTASSPAAFFSSYENSEWDGLVEDATTDDYWRSIAAEIGVKSQEATRMVTNQETLLGELEDKRQSVSGVSLDEEMTNMIKYQHAYNAASRYITSIDEQLETIITSMGLVGR